MCKELKLYAGTIISTRLAHIRNIFSLSAFHYTRDPARVIIGYNTHNSEVFRIVKHEWTLE